MVWQSDWQPYREADKKNSSKNLQRFAGQILDTETGLYYNHFREYDPQTGRYTQSDPIGLNGGINTYAYVGGNPVMFVDPLGLYYTDGMMDYLWGGIYTITGGYTPSQGTVDFTAGFGDTVSFGVTNWVRDKMEINSVVNKCSGAYSAGEWGGIAYGFVAGGISGWRAAGSRAAGKEFSHWIPNRMGGPRSKWNGNYVSPGRHYKHDPYRFPPRSQRSGNKWPSPIQQFDRIPNVYKGAAAGGIAASASVAGNGCECQ